MGEPAAPTVDDVNASLDDRWPHGAITSAAAERIGSEHGSSGVVHRLLVETSTGRHRLLAKGKPPSGAAGLLLDWSSAAVAPPAFDRGHLIIGLALEEGGPLEPRAVLEA